MIRHVVMLHWQPGTSAAAVAAVTEAFAKLPALIPEIKSYQFGPDLGLFEGNADYVLVAEFDNEQDFKDYSSHPDHIELMKAVTMPIMASFSAVQFNV